MESNDNRKVIRRFSNGQLYVEKYDRGDGVFLNRIVFALDDGQKVYLYQDDVMDLSVERLARDIANHVYQHDIALGAGGLNDVIKNMRQVERVLMFLASQLRDRFPRADVLLRRLAGTCDAAVEIADDIKQFRESAKKLLGSKD